MINKSKLLILFIQFVFFSLSASNSLPVDTLASNFYNQVYLYPQEKIYTQTDRSHYFIGDTIWFSNHLVNAQSHYRNSLSNYIYAELINPFNRVEIRVKVMKDASSFGGYIPISEDLAAGNYQLRFYTKYMTGGDESYFSKSSIYIGTYLTPSYSCELIANPDDKLFRLRIKDKELQKNIVPEELYVFSISGDKRKVKIHEKTELDIHLKFKEDEILNNTVLFEYEQKGLVQREFVVVTSQEKDYEVSFFPEGGFFLDGTPNRIAFKAINSYGLGEDIKGVVVNSRGDTLTNFRSEHLGHGLILLYGDSKETYYAICKNEYGKEKRFLLPSVEANKVSLRSEWRDDVLQISLNKSDLTKTTTPLYLLIHCRGIVLYSQQWSNHKEVVHFSSKDMPSGVIQILLVDENLLPISERCVFNQRERDRVEVALTKDKESYGPRENSKVNIALRDIDGSPLEGHFSISVTDDSHILSTNSRNILSTLLLTSELRGYIEQPNYYFSGELQAHQYLDLLMMTQAWKRYAVEKILKGDYEYPKEKMEELQEISGELQSESNAKKKGKNSLVELFAMKDWTNLKTQTDDKGRFTFKGLSFPDSTEFLIKSEDKYLRLVINEDEFIEPELFLLPIIQESNIKKDADTREVDLYRNIKKNESFQEKIRLYQLREVTVTAAKIKKEERISHIASSSFADIHNGNEIIERHKPRNMEDMLKSIPKVNVRRPGSINTATPNDEHGAPVSLLESALILVDGMEFERKNLNTIDPQTVKQIEILLPPRSFILGAKGGQGIISIFTDMSLAEKKQRFFNIQLYSPIGYQIKKEFYSPRYDVNMDTKKLGADMRTTVYWNPSVNTSKAGKATLDFYTSDSSSDYSVVIEGVTTDGKIIYFQEKIER